VVGVASDPFIAREKILSLNPDVLTLDIEMPRMDGLTFLKILAQYHPMPVLVVSSLTEEGSETAMQCMEAGASEVLSKPDGSMSVGALSAQLAHHVKAVYAAGRRDKALTAQPSNTNVHVATSSETLNKPGDDTQHAVATVGRTSEVRIASKLNDKRLLVIGSSTGGVKALTCVIPSLPKNCPPTVVVQHIPSHFSKAEDGDILTEGVCLIAPGGFHIAVLNTPKGYQVRLTQTPPIHFCRPAVDVLFTSAAKAAGSQTTAVLLTGMGNDGAQGMLNVMTAGGDTIAEDESTCVVYGMPRAAGLLNAVKTKLPLPRIAHGIAKSLNQTAV
jgi:two-component system chemotaxis response regulator CheB